MPARHIPILVLSPLIETDEFLGSQGTRLNAIPGEPSTHLLQHLVDRGGYTVQTTEQNDLTVEVGGLD